MAYYVIFTDFFKVTWRKNVTSCVKRSDTRRSGILWGTFCHQPEVSVTSGSKVMAHYLIFTKVVTLTLPADRFSFFFVRIVLGLEDTFCQNIRTIGPAVWSVHREKTDRQTNRQTAVTNILCENRRFRKVKMAMVKIGTFNWYNPNWCWTVAYLDSNVYIDSHKSWWFHGQTIQFSICMYYCVTCTWIK